MVEIIMELQRRIEELSTRVAQLASRLAQAEQSVSKVWQDQGGGGTSIPSTGYYCTPTGVIAGSSTGTADAYRFSSGSGVLDTAGATIRNVYAASTTAGRVITLAKLDDGSYLVLAQSCT
jgi:hypothetical protein